MAAAAAAETASRIDICLTVLKPIGCDVVGGSGRGCGGDTLIYYIVLTVMCDKSVIVYNPSYILFIKMFGV